MTDDQPTLALLFTAAGATEASAVISALSDEGIEAVTSAPGQQGAAPTTSGVHVLVAEASLESARAVLEACQSEVDWDQEQLGERTDDVPLKTLGTMPLLARVGYIVTVIVAVVCLLGMIWWALGF